MLVQHSLKLKRLHPMAEIAPVTGATLDLPGFPFWKEAFVGIVSEDLKPRKQQPMYGRKEIVNWNKVIAVVNSRKL